MLIRQKGENKNKRIMERKKMADDIQSKHELSYWGERGQRALSGTISLIPAKLFLRNSLKAFLIYFLICLKPLWTLS